MSVYPRGNGFEVCVTLPDGRRIRRYSPTRSQGDLLEFQLRRQYLPVIDIKPSVAFRALLDEVMVDWRHKNRRSFDSFFKAYAVSLNQFFGDTDIQKIKRKDVQEFKEWREKHGSKPGTVGNSLKVLRRIFNYAIENEMLTRNPVKGVLIPLGEARTSFGSVDQQNRLLEEAGRPDPSDPHAQSAKDFQDFVFCALRTGIRTGFLKKIRVRDFDPQRSLVTIPRTKKGSPWTVRVLPVVRELLARRSAALGRDDLLLTNGSKPWGGFYKRWYSACKRAGLPNFKPHDCRHTFASDMRAAGVPLDRLLEFLDHSNTKTLLRYAHLGEEFQEPELRKLEGHLESRGAFAPLSNGGFGFAGKTEVDKNHEDG